MKSINNKILLILDIDETLIHASSKELIRKPDFEVFGYSIYKRPMLSEFIDKIKNHFLIAVWSSASDDYVEEIVKQIFDKSVKLEFVWGRSKCTYRRNIQVDEYGYFNSDPNSHYHYIKPLKKLKRKGFELNRMLIVDDSPHKCQDNYGNAVYPKEFLGDKNDDELILLAEYLLKLKDESNIRKLEKRNWRNKIEAEIKKRKNHSR